MKIDRDIKKVEAIERMNLLEIHENAILEFSEKNIINKSEDALLFWLNDDEKEMIEKWENSTGNLVYHIIITRTSIGTLYSLLYVSNHRDEWEMDKNDITFSRPFVYVINKDYEYNSEFGSISINKKVGGLLRVI